MRQERLDLRTPEEPAVALGVIERADSDAVAPQDQCAVGPVPERDGEITPRLLEHPLAPILVEVHPRLGVATGRQGVPPRQELLA